MLTNILSNLSTDCHKRMLDVFIKVKGTLSQTPDYAVALERKSIKGTKRFKV